MTAPQGCGGWSLRSCADRCCGPSQPLQHQGELLKAGITSIRCTSVIHVRPCSTRRSLAIDLQNLPGSATPEKILDQLMSRSIPYTLQVLPASAKYWRCHHINIHAQPPEVHQEPCLQQQFVLQRSRVVCDTAGLLTQQMRQGSALHQSVALERFKACCSSSCCAAHLRRGRHHCFAPL